MWRCSLLAEMVDVLDLDLDLDLRGEDVAGRICIDVASEWALHIVASSLPPYFEGGCSDFRAALLGRACDSPRPRQR